MTLKTQCSLTSLGRMGLRVHSSPKLPHPEKHGLPYVLNECVELILNELYLVDQ